jgi:alkylated DNA repair dioxygenase AlkB
LFDLAHPKSMLATPLGFRYQADFISATEEQELAAALGNLPLKPFEFQGHLGNRRVLSFGLRYDYTRREVQASAAPPEFLGSLLKKVAQFANHQVHEFKQIGINEYRAGAGIGWHRDKPEFGAVVGVSLLSAAKIRFRGTRHRGWERCSCILEPRSVYILTGEARQQWEHSIPPVASLRYSLTFRILASTESIDHNSR